MKTLLFSFGLLLCITTSAQESNVYQSGGLAIKGYDPVNYFESQTSKKGLEKFTFKWKDATWRFASQKNLDLFKAAPDKYAPQYGGYCAWGMKKGYKAKVDPKNAWTIHNNKLYLNYSTGIKSSWSKDKDNYIKQANVNWKKFDPK